MSVKVTRVPNLPAVILEVVEPFDPEKDTATNMDEAIKVKREFGGSAYRIIDIRKFKMSFGDMTMAMGAERNHEGGSSDPEVTTCFIGSGDLVELGSKALAEQPHYGGGKVKLFTSIEEAIEFIRKDMAG